MAARVSREISRLLFFGSDRFSVVSLRALVSLQLPLTIVTKPRCAVHEFANDVGLTVHHWPFTVPNGQFDLGVVVSFGHLIPSASINACRHGMVNVHPSLLPRWRGPAPLVHTILENDERTGVSLITVAKNRFDTGAIIKQSLLKESPRTLEYADLERLTASMGADMLIEFLSDVEGSLAKARPQEETGATKAPKVKPLMGIIDWRKSVIQVDCQRRAIANFEPLTSWYERRKVRLFLLPLTQLILDPNIADVHKDAKLFTSNANRFLFSSDGIPCPGYVFYHKKLRLIAIRCSDGWVWANFVTIEGKKRMTAQDFYNGFLNKSNCKVFTQNPVATGDDNNNENECVMQVNEK